MHDGEEDKVTIKIEPLDGPLGARVLGLDTRKPLTDAAFQQVEQAMLDHIAIVLPELQENVTWLRDFGRRFGPLVPHVLDQYHHPETYEVSVIARNMDTPESRSTVKPAGAFRHSDLSYEQHPSDAIFLYATHLPRSGGDTLVANMYLAYERLPAKTKQRIIGLTATHRWGWNTGGATPKLNERRRLILTWYIRYFGYIRARGVRCCTSVPATPLRSMASAQMRAMHCWRSSLNTP